MWLDYVPGKNLIVFTDGIVEWANDKGKEFGPRRFRKSILKHINQAPDALLDSLVTDVKEFAGDTECDDDLTLIAIKLP